MIIRINSDWRIRTTLLEMNSGAVMEPNKTINTTPDLVALRSRWPETIFPVELT